MLTAKARISRGRASFVVRKGKGDLSVSSGVSLRETNIDEPRQMHRITWLFWPSYGRYIRLEVFMFRISAIGDNAAALE